MNTIYLAYIGIILVALCILGLPLGFLWQMWQDEKELKKQGKLPIDK